MRKQCAGNVVYGRTFYADEPEDLAYLKKLAKDTRGDEDKWPELNLRIHGRPKVSTYSNGCPILEEGK
jgi:hypothetical protein